MKFLGFQLLILSMKVHAWTGDIIIKSSPKLQVFRKKKIWQPFLVQIDMNCNQPQKQYNKRPLQTLGLPLQSDRIR